MKHLILSLIVGLAGIVSAAPTWTTGSYEWKDWTPLDDNILLGTVPAKSGTTTYTWNTPAETVTNGKLEDKVGDGLTLGVKDGTILTWTFNEAMTIEKIRFTAQDDYLTAWNGHAYDGVAVKSIEVLPFGTAEWVSLEQSVSWMGPSAINYAQGINLYATLEAEAGENLAKGIGGLRVMFGAAKRNGNVGNYCAEIEAVGHPSSADANPVVPGVIFTVE